MNHYSDDEWVIKKRRRIFAVIAFCLFLISLMINNGSGLGILFFGWGAFIEAAQFPQPERAYMFIGGLSWYANIFLFVFIVQLLRGKSISFRLALSAFMLGCTVLFFPLEHREGPGQFINTSWSISTAQLYLWLGSIATVLICSLQANPQIQEDGASPVSSKVTGYSTGKTIGMIIGAIISIVIGFVIYAAVTIFVALSRGYGSH